MIHTLAHVARLLAAATTDPSQLLLTYGPGGVVALLFVTGLLVPKSSMTAKEQELAAMRDQLAAANKRITDEMVPRIDLESARKEAEALRNKIEDQVLPALYRSNDTTARVVDALTRVAQRA